MISVIDLGTPTADGRITARIAAVFDYHDLDRDGSRDDPQDATFDDPGWPDAATEAPANQYGTAEGLACRNLPAPVPEAERKIGFALREVQADPSSRRRDERFAVGADRFGHQYVNAAHCVGSSIMGDGITEFRYDPDAAVGARIIPVSAPVVSGETSRAGEGGDGPKGVLGYGQFHYDRSGNLWVPTTDGNEGRGVKVYAKGTGGRRISTSACLETDPVTGGPKRIDRYVAAPAGARPYWGKVCAPDFNLLQTAGLGPIGAIEDDPVSGNVVLTDWTHGTTSVVDTEGTGTGTTFRIGNIVHPMTKLVTDRTVTGPCRANPAQTCTSKEGVSAMGGPVDRSGRLWLAGTNNTPGTLQADSPALWNRRFEQYAVSIDLSRLLGREPRALSARPGQSRHIQAEVTDTAATTRRAGTIATTDIDSVAPVRGCVQRNTIYGAQHCIDPVTGIGGSGFELGDDADPDGDRVQGVPAGTAADYRVTVPKAGTYRVTFRATTRNPAVSRDLVLAVVGGASWTTPITSAGAVPYGEMRDHQQSALVTLPAGTHTLRVTAPAGGWELDWIRFTRQ
jgi:hypothetical protein